MDGGGKAGRLMDDKFIADNAAGISAAAILSLGSGIDRGIVDNADSDFGIKAFWSFGVADITPPAMASESLPVASPWHQLKIFR